MKHTREFVRYLLYFGANEAQVVGTVGIIETPEQEEELLIYLEDLILDGKKPLATDILSWTLKLVGIT